MDKYQHYSLVNILESFPCYSLAIKFLYCILGKECYKNFVKSPSNIRLKKHFNLLLPQFRTHSIKGDKFVIVGKPMSGRTSLAYYISKNANKTMTTHFQDSEFTIEDRMSSAYKMLGVDVYITVAKLFGDDSFITHIRDDEICVMNVPVKKMVSLPNISDDIYNDIIKYNCQDYTFVVYYKKEFFTLNALDVKN